MNDSSLLIITGGGTGGHFFPALALIERFKIEKRYKIVYIGSKEGIEACYVEKLGVNFILFPKLRKFSSILINFFKMYPIIKNAKCTLATGGYVAFLPLLWSRILNIPYVIMEQNVLPGRVNMLFCKQAQYFCGTFQKTKDYLPSTTNFILTGTPLREGFNDIHTDSRNTLLIIGGSQGADKLDKIASEFVIKEIKFFEKNKIKIFHLCRKENFSWLKKLYDRYDIIELNYFYENMPEIYKKTILAISRAGGGVISELATFGIPAIFVPYPYAERNHQELNAREVERIGGGIVVQEKILSASVLSELVKELIANKKRLSYMGRAIKKLSCENASSHIVSLVKEIVK